MRHFYSTFYRRRLLPWLCFGTLLLALGLGQVSLRASEAAVPVSIAAAEDVQQLVTDGIEDYRQGDFDKAIASWQTAYGVYEATQDWPSLRIVSENLARTYQQLGEVAAEIDYWQKAIAANAKLNEPDKQGRLLTEQAQAYSRLGQQRQAIARLCGSDRTLAVDLTSATIGDSDLSECDASSAISLAISTNDFAGQAAALGSLGEVYRAIGEYEQARTVLEQGIAASQQNRKAASVSTNQAVSAESALLNSLGNTLLDLAQVSDRRAKDAKAQGNIDIAALQNKADSYSRESIAKFQQSYQLATANARSATEQLQPLLGLVLAYQKTGDTNAAEAQWQLAKAKLKQLPNSQQKAFFNIRLADLLASQRAIITDNLPTIKALFSEALAIGESLNNTRVISFSLGKLGQIEEQARAYESALTMTQEARLAADQDLTAKDSLYLWDWQAGRILKAQGLLAESRQAYRQAVAVLDRLRSDILSPHRSVQFDFRDRVEPVYRQYAQLTLKGIPTETSLRQNTAAYEQIDSAVTTLDSLQLAELQSYFENDCVISPVTTRVDAVRNSPKTGVISTAILAFDSRAGLSVSQANAAETELAPLKQLVVIMSLPDGSKKVSRTVASLEEITDEVIRFRRALEFGIVDSYLDYQKKEPSKKLYEWLIQPFETEIAALDTLVFVNEGLLRNVPMAALYNERSQKYLIQDVAIATTPSLTLVEPKRIARPGTLNALLMGVVEKPAVPGKAYDALPSVENELAMIAKELPENKLLLNEDFSVAALRQAIAEKDYRILHMATHGNFGFDPADNFIVTGAKQADSFNETLTISELDRLIRAVTTPNRKPIELLALTACDTAIGDNRSTLGLAGVAVRAGVRSAIATLWSVSDPASAELMAHFYDNLSNPDLTKAEALRIAQTAMIESEDRTDRHPYKWASFILIGNWL